MAEFSKFIFGETLEQAIDAIPEESQLKFFRIIKDYGLHGIEPKLTGFELATWVQMKALIDNTMPKRNNASPVSKAGAPFGNKNAQKTTKNNSNNQNNSSELISENNYENNSSELLNDNVNGNVNENEFSDSKNYVDDSPSFSTAIAVAPKAVIASSRSPPAKKGKRLELSAVQLPLFHAAKACFETSEKAKVLMYQDDATTAREMQNLKLLVIRCTKIAPDVTADFLRNVLEHFKVMVNGKYKGKFAFTPRALATSWIWELVIDSLPEDNVIPELREMIRGMFQR